MNYWLELPEADFQKLYDSRSRQLALKLAPKATKRYEPVESPRLGISFEMIGTFIPNK